MKEILAVLLLLATVEGNPFWKGPFQLPGHSFQPPGHSFQPPGHSFQPPGHSFLPPGPPLSFPGLGPGRHSQQNWLPNPQQPGVDFSNAEWVCTNPKTRDMIVIAAVPGSQTVINEQILPCVGCPNQSGCFNSNSPNTNCENQEPNNGNPETTTSATYTVNPQTIVDESTRIDTGEGIIDIRMASN